MLDNNWSVACVVAGGICRFPCSWRLDTHTAGISRDYSYLQPA